MTYRILGWNLTFHLHGILAMLYVGAMISYPLYGVSFSALGMLTITAMLVVILTVHEMAHGNMARALGYTTNQIHFHLLGAAVMIPPARTEEDELLISAAGPLSNFVMAGFGMVAGMIAADQGLLSKDSFLANTLIGWIIINILLGVFNLLPAFPMDGGRILRSTLGFIIRRDRAEKITHMVGVLMGTLLLIHSIIEPSIFGILIGAVLIWINYNEKKI